MEFLEQGDRGEDVKQLQLALMYLGYSVGSTGADGIYGEATAQAVRKYQEEHDEEPTGDLDMDTWADIEIDVDIKQKAAAAAAQTTSSSTVVAAKKYSTVMIGGASGDENGSARGGEPGNQTGKELKIQKWYNGNWNVVLRPNTATLAEELAVQCEGACNNKNIGYDQSDRNTILAAAKAANWNLAAIDTPCECDCSSLMSVCCIACGMPEKYFYTSHNLRTTKTLAAACKKTGKFTELTANKYLTEKDYLKRGDILISNTHTCMVLQNGTKAETTVSAETAPVVSTPVVSTTETIPTVSTPATTSNTWLDRIKALFNTSNSSNASSSTKKKGYTGKVTGGSVYIRTGPSKDYKAIKTVHRGDTLQIIQEKNGWGRIETNDDKQQHWISLKYISKGSD